MGRPLWKNHNTDLGGKSTRNFEYSYGAFSLMCGYSAINTARNTLSPILPSLHLGSNHIAKKFMRGVFNRRPSPPKISSIQDVKRVFNLFRLPAWDIENLQSKTLTQKLAVLLILSACERVQFLSQFVA